MAFNFFFFFSLNVIVIHLLVWIEVALIKNNSLLHDWHHHQDGVCIVSLSQE